LKILIVGSDNRWSIERYFVKYLKQIGAVVDLYPAADIVFSWHSKNIVHKILFKTGIWKHYRKVNNELIEMASSIKPDVIWVFKGMEIYPVTWKKLRGMGIRLANFNPDHPFIISSRGSGNKNVTASVALFDLHFCYIRSLMSLIEEQFHISTIFLPFAFEESDITYMKEDEIQEINRICFQGNPDSYRADMILFLSENGFEVDVYGYGWEKTKLVNRKNISLYPIASRPDFWKKNQAYRIQLNLFRAHNVGSHNMRTFEIPAVGGIQLAEYSVEQAEFFVENEEIFFFRDKSELKQKVEMLLGFTSKQAELIRQKARKRSLESGYRFSDRAMTVYQSFKKMI
jgi:spore maturation protein CgeB